MQSEGPDPGQAGDLAEFVTLLNELRVWAGAVSYRALAKKAGPLMRPPQKLSQSTVADVFQTRRRRLNSELVVAIVRALGVGEDAVGRWRAACVQVHADAKNGGVTGVLRQLPADLATFTGREAESAQLEQAVGAAAASGAPTVVISAIEGMGGAGKTQLAVHVAHRLVRAGRYADVQLFVNLRGFDDDHAPADPAEVLGSFLQALDVPARQIPADPDERSVMFRDRIHGRQALIVLDNAADERQVRSLIPGGPDSLVLITSRRSMAGLDGARLHSLGMFTTAEAVALLARVAGPDRVAAEPETAARIAELCGHLPLAVALVAARLRSRPAWSLTDLVGHLDQAGLRGLRAGGRDVSTILELSYRGLPTRAQEMFRLLSLHPGDDLTVGSAAALSGLGSADAYEALELLLDEHLLQQAVEGRYEFHDLVRAYGRQAASDLAEPVRSAAVTRLLDYYRQALSAAIDVLIPYERARRREIPRSSEVESVTFADVAEAETWMRTELANLLKVVDAAADEGRTDHVCDVSALLYRYFEARGLHRQALVVHGHAVAATAGRSAEPGRQADAASHLGSVLWRLGRYDEATDQFRRALIGYQAAGNKVGVAANLGNMGLIAWHQGRSMSALKRFRRSQTLFAQAGDLSGESRAVNGVGNLYRRLGRYAEAVECFDRAILLGRQAVGNPDAVATGLANRGLTHVRRGDYAQALRDLREALTMMHDAGQHSEGEVMIDLGNLHTRLNDFGEALTHLTRALTICHDHGHPAAEGWALVGLSGLHHATADPVAAADSARRALTLGDAIGEHALRTQAHNHLGQAETALGHLDVATDHHRTALELARVSGDVHQRAKAWDGLAEIHRRRGETELATEHERLAQRIYRKIGAPEADGGRRRRQPPPGPAQAG